MKTKHTQGEWNYFQDGDKTWKVNEGLENAICDCNNMGDAQNKANAKLIAAAPDLLKALSLIIDDYAKYAQIMQDQLGYTSYTSIDIFNRLEIAKSAIKKATE